MPGQTSLAASAVFSLVTLLGVLGVIFRNRISRAAKRNAQLLGQPTDAVGLGPIAQGVLAAVMALAGAIGLVLVSTGVLH